MSNERRYAERRILDIFSSFIILNRWITYYISLIFNAKTVKIFNSFPLFLLFYPEHSSLLFAYLADVDFTINFDLITDYCKKLNEK
ncbi:MAG: hypothetical protein LBC68_00660 [Prevotellaceae bacterium]|nr:hypothetical protein [Prevotellaceae bacterium]